MSNFGWETLAFGGAEIASAITSLGVVAVFDQLAPNVVKSLSKTVSKSIVEPNLDGLEWVMSKICRLDECKPDINKSREERAEGLARTIVLFTPAVLASYIVKVKTRRWGNATLGVKDDKPKHIQDLPWYNPKRFFYMTPHDKKVFVWDEGIHLGSLLAFNTIGHQYSDSMLRTTTSILHKATGWSEQKSKDVATMLVVWELPNVLGAMAGVGKIYHRHVNDPNAGHVANLEHNASPGHTPAK